MTDTSPESPPAPPVGQPSRALAAATGSLAQNAATRAGPAPERGGQVMTPEAATARHRHAAGCAARIPRTHRQEAGPMRDDPTVIHLVTRARTGDQRAWNTLVERYAPLVWSICRRHQLSGTDAEDVSQSVWLTLVRQLGTIRDPAALPGWLATTTAIGDPPVPYTQISARLGIPVGSIGPTRRRLLGKLREHPAITALIKAEREQGSAGESTLPRRAAVAATSRPAAA